MDRLARVLVAEGNTVHRHFIAQALEDTEHVVRTVGTVAEAWTADPRRFDLALISEQLEDEDGLALVRALAADPSAPAPVLLVAPNSRIEPADALAAGAVDLVAKGADMGRHCWRIPSGRTGWTGAEMERGFRRAAGRDAAFPMVEFASSVIGSTLALLRQQP